MISVTTDDRALQEAIQRFLSFSENPTPTLVAIGDYLEESTLRRFDEQVDPDGVPWAPLAPSTIAAKQRKGQSSNILVATGATRASINYQIVGNSIEVSAGTEQAPFLQEGTGDMPARVFLGLSDQDIEAIADIILSRLEGGALPSNPLSARFT
jgi:phage virion morphogenesis protein